MIEVSHLTHNDSRGSYTPIPLNVLNEKWDQCSISVNDNIYTFRELHYQTNPPQKKYVKVVKGSIVDFMVDLETGEVDFCEVKDTGAVFIPNTKAHGFLTLEPNTIVVYMVEGNYNPQSEHSIVWSDNPKVSEVIKSYIGDHELTISEKDKLGK